METFTSNPAVLANAELLKRMHGRRVRTVLKVTRVEGATVYGQSPDGLNITVRQAVKSEEFTPFVEFIGVVDGELSLRFEKCTNFGDNFDMANFNHLCEMANNQHQDIFI